MQPTIDLNADVGEERGDDRALLALVSSANIAAGAHAGGGVVLEETVSAAVAARCALGAHPSYADREGFGRNRYAHRGTVTELRDSIVEQVLLVGRACARAGAALSHVKPHGGLYNDAADDPDVADCVLDAAQIAGVTLRIDSLAVIGLAGSMLGERAAVRGVPYVAEAFADRAYDERGRLVPRERPGAVLHDVAEIRERVLDIAVRGCVRTPTRTEVPIRAQTICLHGDTPEAIEHARVARAALLGAGISVCAVSR